MIPDNGFGELSVSNDRRKAIAFQFNAATELVNSGSTGGSNDRVFVIVPAQAIVFVWDTRAHYTASHVSFPFATGKLVPSTIVMGSFQVQLSNTEPNISICDAGQWNSVGGAGTRSDPFIITQKAGASRTGCYSVYLIAQGV